MHTACSSADHATCFTAAAYTTSITAADAARFAETQADAARLTTVHTEC